MVLVYVHQYLDSSRKPNQLSRGFATEPTMRADLLPKRLCARIDRCRARFSRSTSLSMVSNRRVGINGRTIINNPEMIALVRETCSVNENGLSKSATRRHLTLRSEFSMSSSIITVCTHTQ